MKWISISELLNHTRKVTERFPLQFVLVVAAAAIAYVLADRQFTQTSLISMLIFCGLSLVLSLSVLLFAEAGHYNRWKSLLLQLAALLLCFFITLWLDPWIVQAHAYILVFLALAFHLAVSFAAFLHKGAIEHFWHFNKTLFLRLLTAALYSFVIVMGLYLAVFAVKELFSVSIKDTVYMKIFLLVAIGFNTLFFLSGIPDVNMRHAREYYYPKGLKIFTQYVLIPLMIIYLGILLLYEGKILVEWQLPNGYVSTLILAYTVFGILSLLLIYPIKDTEGNRWIRWFSQWFYIMMLPLIVLLSLAIYKRVSDYGITIERYALIALAVWLSAITLYFLFSQAKSIKIIPLSLAVVALIAALGPLSASEVSKRSQQKRLKVYMHDNSKKAKHETTSIIKYLVRMNGLTALQPFTPTDLAPVQDSIIAMPVKHKYSRHYEVRDKLTDRGFAILNIESTDKDFVLPATIYGGNKYDVVNISGYDYVVPLEYYLDEQKFKIDSLDISVKKNQQYCIVRAGNTAALQFPVDSLLQEVRTKYANSLATDDIVHNGELSIIRGNQFMDAKLIVTQFTGYDGNASSDSYRAYLLFRKK